MLSGLFDHGRLAVCDVRGVLAGPVKALVCGFVTGRSLCVAWAFSTVYS